MAWSQSDLEKLDAAIASGVRSVTYADGRRVEYHSLDQMMAARSTIAARLQMEAGARRRLTPYYRSGL